jgi:carbon storage regulator CsrA
MLVLTRKLEESVVVGDGEMPRPMLTITVLEITGGKVRLGFQADPAVHVHRMEVWRRIEASARPIVAIPDPGLTPRTDTPGPAPPTP